MTQMPKNPVNTYCYTSLHITTYITIIEPCIIARIMDNQVLFKADLQDTSWEGGIVPFFSSLPSSGGCLWFGLEILGSSRSAIAVAVQLRP